MKFKAFIQLIGFYTVAAVGVGLVWGASMAFAASSDTSIDEADLRPVWMADQSVYGQPSALIYSDQNPSFMPQSLQQQMLANHSIQGIEQQYVARSRDYDMRQSYGIATTMDESSYVSDVSGMGKSMFTAARLTPVRQYQQNFQQSSQQGGISQPVATVGAAAALGSGTPIPFDLGLGCGAKGNWSGDLVNEHGELNLNSQLMNAKFEMNMKDLSQDPTQPLDPSGAVERYRVSFNREVAFSVTSSLIYGSSSNSFAANLSRPIYNNLVGTVGTTRPAGDNISGAPAQVSGGVSYGLTF